MAASARSTGPFPALGLADLDGALHPLRGRLARRPGARADRPRRLLHDAADAAVLRPHPPPAHARTAPCWSCRTRSRRRGSCARSWTSRVPIRLEPAPYALAASCASWRSRRCVLVDRDGRILQRLGGVRPGRPRSPWPSAWASRARSSRRTTGSRRFARVECRSRPRARHNPSVARGGGDEPEPRRGSRLDDRGWRGGGRRAPAHRAGPPADRLAEPRQAGLGPRERRARHQRRARARRERPAAEGALVLRHRGHAPAPARPHPARARHRLRAAARAAVALAHVQGRLRRGGGPRRGGPGRRGGAPARGSRGGRGRRDVPHHPRRGGRAGQAARRAARGRARARRCSAPGRLRRRSTGPAATRRWRSCASCARGSSASAASRSPTRRS